MRVWCAQSNNLLADATQLFCRMVQQGVVDAVHFSILVKGLSKYNNHGVCLALEAYSVLQSSAAFRRSGAEGGKNNHGREGERNQSQAALNTISFNALLHLCVVNGRMEDALRLFHDMERQDTVAPDLVCVFDCISSRPDVEFVFCLRAFLVSGSSVHGANISFLRFTDIVQHGNKGFVLLSWRRPFGEGAFSFGPNAKTIWYSSRCNCLQHPHPGSCYPEEPSPRGTPSQPDAAVQCPPQQLHLVPVR